MAVYDIVVIGGGPAGYHAAIKASQLGGKVAIVEKGPMGGTCLNVGCIPAKTYLKNAEIIEEISKAENRGIVFTNYNVSVDIDRLVQYKNDVVMTLTNGVVGLLKSNNIDIYKGIGRLTKDRKISIDDKEIIEGRKIILAGGSKVANIGIKGIENPLVLTSDNIFNIKEIPETLLIIGGGVIGVELASVFKVFGSEVIIVEMMDRIVPNMDREISEFLKEALEEKGIKIITSTKIDEIKKEDNKLIVSMEGKDSLVVDKVLLSIGRAPDLRAIGEMDFEMINGRLVVNEYMETSQNGIYAPGDINGIKMLAHAASKMGEIAAKNALGHREKINFNNIPQAIYTIPEVGAVGLTEEEARKKYDILIGKFPFVGNGRALASGQTRGFVKVIADKKYGEILGVHIIGIGAAELINEAAVLMETEITIYEAGNIVHGHPSYGEALTEAINDCLGNAIHLPKLENME